MNTLKITEEYLNLKQIAESGQCFRWTEIEPDSYIVISKDKVVQMVQQEDGILVFCPKEDEEFWTEYLDMSTDYGLLQQEIDTQDVYLRKAAKAGKGIRILKQDLWEIIVSFMISQNSNIPRITKTIDTLCTNLGNPMLMICNLSFTDKREIMCYTFPDAATLANADLSEYGLGYRERYIRELAKQAVDGTFDIAELQDMDALTSRTALKKVLGIGDKVADCIRLFGLHQLGAFPIDTWINKIQKKHYAGHFPIEQYEQSAGVMQQYLFNFARNYE